MQIKSCYVKTFMHQGISEKVLNTCGIETKSIRFDSRRGKWSQVFLVTGITGDNLTKNLVIMGLFEHDMLGDMTDYVLAYFDWYSGDNVWKEIEGTYDDIWTAMYDAFIIENIYE